MSWQKKTSIPLPRRNRPRLKCRERPPKMEQAEIPDVGGGPAPSAKVIDLSAMRSTPEKDAPPTSPRSRKPSLFPSPSTASRNGKKPMPEPEKPKPKRGRPAKAEKAAPTEPGAKKEVKAEKAPAEAARPRRKKRPRSRPSRPRLARPMRPPRKRQRPRPRKYRLRPVTLPAPRKRKSSILTFPTCTRSRIILSVSVTMRK